MTEGELMGVLEAVASAQAFLRRLAGAYAPV